MEDPYRYYYRSALEGPVDYFSHPTENTENEKHDISILLMMDIKHMLLQSLPKQFPIKSNLRLFSIEMDLGIDFGFYRSISLCLLNVHTSAICIGNLICSYLDPII